MGFIKQVNVGGTLHDIRDSRIITLADNGTTTAGTWLAKVAEPAEAITEYVDGQLFLYKITKAGTLSTTLNINNLGAKPVFRNGTSRLTTQFGLNNYILLAYNSTNACFRVVNFYDSNTTYSVATTSADGLMSSADKTKLDAITLEGGESLTPSSGYYWSLYSGDSLKLYYTPTQNYHAANKDYVDTCISNHSHDVLNFISTAQSMQGNNTDIYIQNECNSGLRTSDDAVLLCYDMTDLENCPYLVVNDEYIETVNAPLKPNSIMALTSSTGTSYGVGASGKVLKSNGTSVYWGDDNNTTYSLSSFGITATAAELNKLDGVTATATELNYVDGVTSNIQTQLNGKAASSHTHNYAGSSSAGGAATSANKVNTNLAIKLNSGTTEGTNLFTFNGSAAKTVNITPSAIGAATSSHTHSNYVKTTGDESISGFKEFSSGISLAGHALGADNFGGELIYASSDSPILVEDVNDTVLISIDSAGKLYLNGVATPTTNDAAANKSYVDTEVAKKASSGHTHTTSLATSTGTSSITLAHGGKYQLTAGGKSVIFTMPSADGSSSSNPVANYNIGLIAGTVISVTGTASAKTYTLPLTKGYIARIVGVKYVTSAIASNVNATTLNQNFIGFIPWDELITNTSGIPLGGNTTFITTIQLANVTDTCDFTSTFMAPAGRQIQFTFTFKNTTPSGGTATATSYVKAWLVYEIVGVISANSYVA